MAQFTIEFDRETDGSWIAEITALPGAMCYDSTKEEASRNVEALALRILADTPAAIPDPEGIKERKPGVDSV